MSTPNANPEDRDPAGLEEALRRDAGRMQPANFDADLHQEGMDRVRQLAEKRSARFSISGFGLSLFRQPMAVVGFAVLVVATIFVLLRSPGPKPRPREEVVDLKAIAPPIASVWSYEAALSRDDSALLELLDRDAQSLLPHSPLVTAGFL